MRAISRTVLFASLLGGIVYAGIAAESLKIARIGKVVDAQGLCTLQPKLQERWTPVAEGVLLNPGDWLRTDPRGANALQVRLGAEAKLVLGPGGLVEVVDAGEIRLVRGELAITPAVKAELVLHLPGGKKQRVKATSVFRVKEEQVTQLEQEPDWLKAFKGAVTAESMGALLARVEGRDLPLTLGYHKVTVDIRDQIARTVIEESFVNHTDSRLEGVFYFPLPQDASISGFGMWIGDELVEADVVGKQRAREIYETILRERRDPGLLEWTGGNIFKARVFPILAHSEKRIKITYTQVLPMQGGRCRYSYALQSEMLKQHPLRELALNVKISSALPLKSVTCPTHAARVSQTARSAQVEFSAQEYTPRRDFEVEIETDARGREAVLVPHRRGDDGYFLLLVSSPDAGGDWQRTLVADGPPLDLILAADTSASMDRAQREAQDRFIASLLGALGPQDRCRLLAADADRRWFRDGAAFAPAEEEIAAAREFLAARPSLGWTDMQHTLSNVLARATEGTLIVYVGDGIGTTGDADPVTIAQALKRLYQGVGTVHAVATGSSFEPAILKALAGLGGGSFRRIEGRNGAQTAAMALLGEIAQPVIRDLAIEFKGLRAARVYPEVLPNLCAGMQQIVLGRYLPEGRDQAGEVVVTGARDGKPVRFKAMVELKDAESGNEFIPRLWARMHLDALLEQGRSQAVKDEIIALSEEYNLMTPYTSLLVLESDEDRERFKVKRRFVMRDGERFFAAGRDAANLDLRRQQMRLAGQWRRDLRRSVLRELLELGRDLPGYQELTAWFGNSPYGEVFKGPMMVPSPVLMNGIYGSRTIRMAGGSYYPDGGDASRMTYAASGRSHRTYGADARGDRGELKEDEEDLDAMFDAGTEAPADREDGDDFATEDEPMVARMAEKPSSQRPSDLKAKRRRLDSIDFLAAGSRLESHNASFAARGRPVAGRSSKSGFGGGYGYGWNSAGVWPADILPPLPAPAPAVTPRQPGQTVWPEDACRISDSLLRRPVLAAPQSGLAIELAYSGINPRTQDVTYEMRLTMLYSPRQWVSRLTADRARTLTHWADDETRGVVCEAMQLGRRRQAQKSDVNLQLPGFSFYADHSLTPMAQALRSMTPALKTDEQGNVVLTLRYPNNPTYEQRLSIDPRRRVLLRRETWSNGKMTARTTFDGFVEVAGCWWATKVTSADAEGRTTGVTTASIKAIDAKSFGRQFKAALPDPDRAIVIREPLPALATAKQADLEKRASFEDLLTLIGHYGRSRQWDRVNDLWRRAEALVKSKPGVEWMADLILAMSRRNDELSQRYLERAGRFVADKPRDEFYLCTFLQGRAGRVMQTNERLVLHEALRPVFERQAARRQAGAEWRKMQAQLLQQAGRRDEARAGWESLAREFPADTGVQIQYVNAMAGAGELPAALPWIEALLARPGHWTQSERDAVRNSISGQMQNRAPTAEWLAFVEEWLADGPAYQHAYQNYLMALIRMHQVEKANALIKQWAAEGVAGQGSGVRDQESGGEGQVRALRLRAAVQVALGGGYYYGQNSQYDERWNPLLVEVVRETHRSSTLHDLANQIMRHRQFRQSKEAAGLRRALVDVLRKDAAELDWRHIQSMVTWLQAADPALPDETWQAVGRAVTARWEQEPEPAARRQLGQTAIGILRRCGAEGGVLAFLHRQVKEAPVEYRESAVRQLFDELLAQPWNVEFEDECFSLLDRLSSATNAEARLPVVVAALYDLVDAMQAGRYKAALDAVPGKEKMSRTEFKSLQRRKREEAETGLMERLAGEAGKQDPALAPWLTIERIAPALRQKQNARALAGECRELLGVAPAVDGEQTLLQWHLADRCLTALACLAARQPGDETLVAPLIKFLDQGIARNPDSPYWQHQKYRLLVALDRPAELEKTLTAWVEPAKADNMWRVALGYLMAERDRVPEAIGLFEAVQAADELGPRELRALADWYLVRDQRDRHADALIEALMAEEEHLLSDRLYRMLRPWHERSEAMSRELDPETVNIFKALFRKSQQPRNYINRLREFYRYTRDFRLLECLAEGMLGHSAQQAYPFLAGLQALLDEVRDEASVDSIVRHLGKVRERAGTRVDRRALDFLELQAERRAAELLDQPGPHARNALAAMKRVFKGDWASGERRLMADALAGLGRIKGEELGREQLRQLAELHKSRQQPAEDRLHIAQRLAETQWAYDRRDDALATFEAALAEFRVVGQGTLPATANSALARFVQYLRDAHHFARAERFLQAEIKRPANKQQVYWMKARLFEVYTSAIRSQGTVSLGSGQALYAAVLDLYLAELASDDPNHRRQLIDLMCSFFRAARDGKIDPAGLREFAFETFPKFLKRETDPGNYHRSAAELGQTLHDLLGAATGMEFLIERIEQEPDWVRAAHNHGWRQHAHRLARWRGEWKDPGRLADRLLRIVTDELRRDLRTRNQSNRVIYYRHNRFWAEKAQDFLAVANEVWDEQRPSAAAAKYIGAYLRHGLDQTARAIAVLDAARHADRLDEEGLSQLARYQHEIKRFEDSIPVLDELVGLRPDTIDYRTRLMRACFKTDRAGKLRELLTATDQRFHERGLWQEVNIAALAYSCLENGLHVESVAYYDELIPLHQRTQPGRGIGNGTLSSYYARLSEAHAALRHTVAAVEAAAGAVVSWGPREDNRRDALTALRRVLSGAPDLGAYVAHLARQVRETGLENPTVRQAIGQVYLERKEYDQAAHHLRLAAETQPNDRRTHELLVKVYELANDPQGAIRQLLASVELSRRDINLYRSLGDRFKAQTRVADAERAYTSIVEMQPNESESHGMLAGIRQAQGRWPEAIEQWRQVVRVRTLEPTGLLKLAEAQMHEQLWDDALLTIDALLRRDWPERFGNVRRQAQDMKVRLEKAR